MVTYSKIISAGEGLKKIASMDLKIKEAIMLSRLIKKLDEESLFYYEQREKICTRFGKLDKEKDMYFIPEESREEASDRMKELHETEVDLGEKLRITVPEGARIDAVSLIQVEDFIEFVFEEENEDGN